MKKYLLPMMTQAAESMKKAGTTLAPIPRIEYIHSRHSTKRKWEAIEARRNSINNNMSEDMQLVTAYTEECKRREGSTVTPPQKKQRASTRLSTTQSRNDANNASIIDLPLPTNGKEYTKPEAVQILAQYDRRTKDIASAMREMIRLRYVPAAGRTIRRLLKLHVDGQPILNTPWSKAGRIPLASLREVQSIAENEMEREHGRVWTGEDITGVLAKKHAERLSEAGVVPLTTPKFSNSSKKRYTSLFASMPNVSITKSSVKKPPHRFAAEGSLRRAINLLHSTAYSHTMSRCDLCESSGCIPVLQYKQRFHCSEW
jgi:hypothetical protein